ncbi:MAG: hypothetical protein JNL10_08255 [Verrucomicrobiales bacterium]|nr:hypothetical protein [Verrucomicrobiales bacterium]
MNSKRPFSRAASLTLAALVLLPFGLRAQDPAPKPTPAPSAEKPKQKPPQDAGEGARARRDAAMAELGLTDDQRDKLKTAQKEQADKVRAVREDTSLTAEQRTAKMRELRDSFAATAKSILTPDQFAKWQKMRDTRRPRPTQDAPGGGATDSQEKPAK